jgi:hypothetical protein
VCGRKERPLEVLLLAEAADSGAGSGGSGGAVDVSATSDGDLALAALPDAGRLTLDGVGAAKGAVVLRMLSNLNLLDNLTEGGTVAGTVLTNNADLLGALALHVQTGRRNGKTVGQWGVEPASAGPYLAGKNWA